MLLGGIIKDVLSGGAKYPKGRGAPVAMAKKNRDAKKRSDMMDTVMRNNDRSNNKSAGTSRGASRGPTAAEQVASARAAEKAAMKKKGKARRKKYEAAQTMAKKMKLIFLD